MGNLAEDAFIKRGLGYLAFHLIRNLRNRVDGLGNYFQDTLLLPNCEIYALGSLFYILLHFIYIKLFNVAINEV